MENILEKKNAGAQEIIEAYTGIAGRLEALRADRVKIMDEMVEIQQAEMVDGKTDAKGYKKAKDALLDADVKIEAAEKALEGLRGRLVEQIPLEARIMTVADCFDAMTSDRPYRPAMTRNDAIREILVNRGTHFSSQIADAFIDILNSMPDDLYNLISDRKYDQFVSIN